MRRASYISQKQVELQWEMPTGYTPDALRKKDVLAQSAAAEVDAARIERALTMAQRIGLPPALSQDLCAMWYDPVATLNQSAIELGTVGDAVSPEIVDRKLDVLDSSAKATVRAKEGDHGHFRGSFFSWGDTDDATRSSSDIVGGGGDDSDDEGIAVWIDLDDDLEGNVRSIESKKPDLLHGRGFSF